MILVEYQLHCSSSTFKLSCEGQEHVQVLVLSQSDLVLKVLAFPGIYSALILTLTLTWFIVLLRNIQRPQQKCLETQFPGISKQLIFLRSQTV